jgi:hypothetical protein
MNYRETSGSSLSRFLFPPNLRQLGRKKRGRKMDELNITKQEPEQEAQPTATAPANNGDTERTFTQAEVDAIVKDRLDRERKAREKAQADAKAKAEAELLAKNAEWEKLAKQREDEIKALSERLKQKEVLERKRAVAEKTGLPVAIADRLTGETDEELEADAKAILEALPKSPRPNPGATNPGHNATGKGMTDEQKRLLLYGGGEDPFKT